MEVVRKTKGEIPSLPFFNVKEKVLGKKYQLSLSFVDTRTQKNLSKEYKGSPNHMNTLAFPLDKDEGEITMNLQTIRKEAKKYKHTYHEHLLFLFIHSCLHLKGHKHGEEMERQEDKLFNMFK